MDSLDASAMRGMLNAMADTIITNKDHLNEIDSGIGDADHGTGMAQSFTKARDKLAASTDETVAALLKAFSTGILGGGGGASGALFSGIFSEGAKVLANAASAGPAEFALWWRAGLTKVVERGKAQPGDKTMVDALIPTVEALEANTGKSLADQLGAAAAAAQAGVEATKTMVAGQGRSRYAGERSLGHQDAGATSVALLFQTMQKFVQ